MGEIVKSNELTGTAMAGIVLAVSLLVIYPILMRVLLNWIEPTRMRFDSLAKELLASHHVSEELKQLIDRMMDDIYEWRTMAILTVKFPALLFGRLFGLVEPVKLPKLPDDKETTQKFAELVACHIRSSAAANPIFTVIFMLEYALLAMVLVPLGMLSRLADFSIKLIVYFERNHNFHHT